jgi:hypothetical protein
MRVCHRFMRGKSRPPLWVEYLRWSDARKRSRNGRLPFAKRLKLHVGRSAPRQALFERVIVPQVCEIASANSSAASSLAFPAPEEPADVAPLHGRHKQ